jgi:hypothetical protein
MNHAILQHFQGETGDYSATISCPSGSRSAMSSLQFLSLGECLRLRSLDREPRSVPLGAGQGRFSKRQVNFAARLTSLIAQVHEVLRSQHNHNLSPSRQNNPLTHTAL